MEVMTLDEAIKHAEEIAEENEKFCYKKGGEGGYFNEGTDWNNAKCAAEHRQLSAWLKDYKRLLAIESGVDIRCGNCKHDEDGSGLCDECWDDVRHPKWEAVE